MTDTFIPLSTLPSSNASTFVPLHLKLSTPSNSKPEKIEQSNHVPETCASPKIILQKDKDVVTGIRIECACGQVTELSCVY